MQLVACDVSGGWKLLNGEGGLAALSSLRWVRGLRLCVRINVFFWAVVWEQGVFGIWVLKSA